MIGRPARGGLLCLALLGAVAAGAASAPSEPAAYRTEAYHAPVPHTLRGAQVLSTAEAAALWRAKSAVFIDVLSQPPRPAGLPAGTIWRPKPRFDIPGSVWLPDTGYGELAAMTEDYFRHGLRNATGDDADRTLVFYCRQDCWMSWNAARRAISLGYRHVAWYPGGTDEWTEAKLPLERREPVPGTRD